MNHIHPITTKVTTAQRSLLLGHRPAAIWFTGLSGSGKSTLAVELESQLYARGIKTYLLDGDNVRNGLNAGLGFSGADRQENIRRIGEVTKLFVDAGLVVLSAFISPFRADRAMVRDLVGKDRFIEVFVDCPLEECERRDVKGLYANARQGVIREFTGIDSPYEAPVSPDVHIQTNVLTPEQSVETILKNILPRIKSV